MASGPINIETIKSFLPGYLLLAIAAFFILKSIVAGLSPQTVHLDHARLNYSPGLQPGERVENFDLAKHTDGRGKFYDLFGKKGLLVVFLPKLATDQTDQRQLIALRHLAENFHSLGVQVAVISHAPWPDLANLRTKHQINFPLLSDPLAKTGTLFGNTNTEGQLIAGSLLIDGQHLISRKYFLRNPEQRIAFRDIFYDTKNYFWPEPTRQPPLQPT